MFYLIALFLILLISVYFDPKRDIHFGKSDWLKGHIYKWLNVYPVWGLIYFLIVFRLAIMFDLVLAIICGVGICAICWLLWQISMRLEGIYWKSWIIKLIEKIRGVDND